KHLSFGSYLRVLSPLLTRDPAASATKNSATIFALLPPGNSRGIPGPSGLRTPIETLAGKPVITNRKDEWRRSLFYAPRAERSFLARALFTNFSRRSASAIATLRPKLLKR